MNKKLLTTSLFFATSIAMALDPLETSETSLPWKPWIGSSTPTPYYVNTGLDKGTNPAAGYWYAKTDYEEGGKSKVVWPVETEKADPDSLATIIEHCQGVCGTAKLTKEGGTATFKPFVTVGFNVAGKNENGELVVLGDASDWGGICITYRSDNINPWLQLSMGDDINESAIPTRKLDGGSKITCIPWEDFKPPLDYGHGEQTITGKQAAKQLVSINFKMQGAKGRYKFNICGIGPYGKKIEGKELPTGAESLPTSCPEFHISLKIPEISVNAKWSPQGNNYEATIFVMDGDYKLTEDKDYKIIEKIVNNNKVETTIEGMGDYTGTVKKTFDKPKSITDNSIIVADIPMQTYVDFRQVCPSSSLVIVTDGKDTLKAGSDYIFECSNNTDITSGTLDNAADLKITGINKYAGEITKKFFIWENIGYYAAVQVFEDAEGKAHAEIDGAYDGTDAVAFEEDITVESVVFNREFSVNLENGGFSTIMLPFDVQASSLTGVKSIFEFSKVFDNNGKKTVGVTYVWCNKTIGEQQFGKGNPNCHELSGELKAYTPYLIEMETPTLGIKGGVVLKSTTKAKPDVSNENWVFRGVLQKKDFSKNDQAIQKGIIWAFAGSARNGASIGKFVQFGNNTWVNPFRAYLVDCTTYSDASECKDDENQSEASFVSRYRFADVFAPASSAENSLSAKVPMRVAASETASLEGMEVVIMNGDKERPTVIGHMNPATGEIRMLPRTTQSYDLKGRKVVKGKKAKGAYYRK